MFSLLTVPWFKLEGWFIPGTHLGVHPFGMLVAAGLIVGMRLAVWYGERNGIRATVINDCALHVVIIGFILGHVFDLTLYYPDQLLHEPWRLLFIWENLSSYGGVFGSIVGGLYWSARRKVPLMPVYDCICFGFPLGWMFGRFGCFVVHDHPGKQTDFFLAVENYQYPGLPAANRHDLGLYEVFWAAAVTLLFLSLSRRKRPCGFYAALVALLYAPVRFGLDFFRVADETYSGFTPAHYASFFAVVLGVTAIIYARQHGHMELPTAVRLGSKEAWPPPTGGLG